MKVIHEIIENEKFNEFSSFIIKSDCKNFKIRGNDLKTFEEISELLSIKTLKICQSTPDKYAINQDSKFINLLSEFGDCLDEYVPHFIFYLYKEYKDYSIVQSGNYWYRKLNYMGWHTNADHPYLRIYFSFASEDNKSYFSYLDENGEIIKSYDKAGWNLRKFQISKSDPLWHCVYSDAERISVGFRVIKI